MQMKIQQVTRLPSLIAALEHEAVAEGFSFITRLTSEWDSGINRFDALEVASVSHHG